MSHFTLNNVHHGASYNFKEYPQDAAQIREIVENRRHYLNIIYAAAILSTFQMCTSVGWYTYLVEAYAHFAGSAEHFWIPFEVLVMCMEISMLYLALYTKKNALTVFLVLFYFLHASMKLFQISTMHPDPGFREHFSILTRRSEYDAMSLIYDSVIFITTIINCAVCCCATWHFTPLVIVKMNYKETTEDAVAQAMKKLKRTKLTTYDVRSSDDESGRRISRGANGRQFISKNHQKKTVRTRINENADVTVTTSGAMQARGEVRVE